MSYITSANRNIVQNLTMNVFGEATPLSMHQVVKGVAIWSNFPHHIVTNIPVLLSLKNDLKTNGFLTENAAKAKCPV